jgi:methylmalonyl-CoA/ethylmalonyl-CoA epimerase
MAPEYRARLSLHHIGYAVANIQAMAELYVGRFGYELCSEVIHDPIQTAYVQFLKLAGDRAYLELVTPDGPNSKITQAVRKGGGLNHLCYSVADIETATQELSSTGMLILTTPVPAVAFNGRHISWLCGEDLLLIELVEEGLEGGL